LLSRGPFSLRTARSTAITRTEGVPSGMSCSGQSRRGQFQIGKSSQHSRRVGGRVLALPPLATNHSLLTTSSPNRHIPELEFGLTPTIVSNLKFSNRHTLARRSFAVNHDSLFTNHCLSNRYNPRLELPVTHSKQTTVVLSNRYKFVPSGGVTSWLPPRPALCASTRYTVKTGIAVTHSKQTTALLSTRYKKPPPGGATKC
jgi:hypothetical protein